MLETLFKYANTPIIIWDADFTITRTNLAFEKLTGLTSGQIIGNNLTQLFPFEQIKHYLDPISNTYLVPDRKNQFSKIRTSFYDDKPYKISIQ